MFRPVKSAEFNAALRDSPASARFRDTYAKLMNFDAWIDQDAVVHVGDIRRSGSFSSAALCTLIIGDVEIDGTIDLGPEGGHDEGGLFIVIGNVTCRNFIGHYGKCCLIDGDLVATDAIINAFGDSGLWVVGSLRTKLFIGADIWAEVGGRPFMDYGVGYCLPLGYDGEEDMALYPAHDEDETAAVVVPEPSDDGYAWSAEDFAPLIRAGKPIFR